MLAGILIVGIGVPAYMTIIGSLSTDIIGGTCIPWRIHSSYAVKTAKNVSTLLVTYLLPLVMMLFCYSRIIGVLTHKVTSRAFRFAIRINSIRFTRRIH